MSLDDGRSPRAYQACDMRNKPTLEDRALGERIKQARKAARLSQSELADMIKPSPVTDAAISGWERTGKVKRENLLQLPDLLRVRAEWLYEGRGSMRGDESSVTKLPNERSKNFPDYVTVTRDADLHRHIESLESGVRDLPIMGQAAAGDGSGLNNDGQPVGWTVRPPELLGVPNAYATYIHDDSLEPVRWQGQISCLHPGMPPRPNDIVVVQIRPEPGQITGYREIVKAYVKTAGGKLILRQYNPPEDNEIDRDRVISMHVEVATYRRA